MTRLVSVILEGRQAYGWVDEDTVAVPGDDWLSRFPSLTDVLAVEAVTALCAESPARRVPLSDADLLPVIPHPGKMFCVGINFRAHMAEMGRGEPDYPWLFTRCADSLVGHGQPLTAPCNSAEYDYEGELAFVIGRDARHVAAADALAYVAGYTCVMDGSLRDFQKHGSQFTAGKNFDRSGACGPWLVTADELPDPARLHLETRLNGEVMQAAPISDLKFGVPALIAYITSFCTLRPGDIVSTGTPGGVGFARDPQVYLRPGDIIEVDIDGIGTLRNPVIAEN